MMFIHELHPHIERNKRTKMVRKARPNPKVVVKENPVTYLVADADFALQSARSSINQKDAAAAGRFARTAILLYAISLEGFINFIYEYFEVPESSWKHLSFKDKWLRASTNCLPLCGIVETEAGVVYRPGDPIQMFAAEAEPFVSFLELRSFRNSLAHLKAAFAEVEPRHVEVHLNREGCYPASLIPYYLRLVRVEHAETARKIYQAMTTQLDLQMKGMILKLFEIEGGAWVESPDWLLNRLLT